MKEIKALGEYVVFESGHELKSPGDQDVSSGGIILTTKSVGEIPKYAQVISVGADVPDSYGIKVGTLISIPNGHMKYVPDPEVAFNNKDEKEGRKISSAHYKVIAAIYN